MGFLHLRTLKIFSNFEAIIQYSYDVLYKKLRFAGFNLQQDHIIQALITRISLKTTLHKGIIFLNFGLNFSIDTIRH